MPSLDDFLAITPTSAAEQWTSIARRAPVAPGGRQVDYLPVETLICFALGLVAEPGAAGRINLRATDADVRRYATLLRRTPKSLAAKLQNLNGRREHSAANERELWIELTSGNHAFDTIYQAVLLGARDAGIDDEQAPDILGADAGLLQLVGDATRVSDTDLLNHARDARWLDDANEDLVTERVVVGVARVGHSQFARKVLAAANFGCAFCGLSARRHAIPSSRLLVASHVKPWRASTPAERVDPLNGVAACPTHDAAFEHGLIQVTADGTITTSARVAAAAALDSSWERAFGGSTLAPRLLLDDARYVPRQSYLDWQWNAARVTVEASD